MNYYIIIWLIVIFLLISIIIQIKKQQKLLQLEFIKHFNHTENPCEIWLFVDSVDPHIELYKTMFLNKNPNSTLYLVYKGPVWRAALLEKRMSASMKFIVDEHGDWGARIGLNDYPGYVVFNKQTQFIRVGRLVPEMKLIL